MNGTARRQLLDPPSSPHQPTATAATSTYVPMDAFNLLPRHDSSATGSGPAPTGSGFPQAGSDVIDRRCDDENIYEPLSDVVSLDDDDDAST